MNVKLFNNNVNFFIFTTNKTYAKLLKSYCTTDTSISYWQKVIDILQNNNIQSNFIADENDNSCAIDILNEFNLNDDELAYYIDDNDTIIDNFLPLDNARLNALIQTNIAPYYAANIGIFKIVDNVPVQKPSGYILLNSLKRTFGSRLYRVGLMSDIHYNDNNLTDHGVNPDNHTDIDSEAIADIKQVLDFYQNKEDVKFVCCSGDITTDYIKHLLNFKAMTIKNMPTTPFYSCFGNHDFKATSHLSQITEADYLEYEKLGISIKGKTRLQLWNSILIPENPAYTINYENPNDEYGKTSYWFEVPTIKGKSDIYVFLSVNYLREDNRNVTLDYTNISSNDISIDTNKSGYNETQQILSSTYEYNVALKFTNVSQRFVYNYRAVDNSSSYVRINKCKILDANGMDVTSQINSSSPGIGIYGDDNKYKISGEFKAKTSGAGDKIEFPLSSSFATNNPNITLPVTLYMDVDLRSDDPNSDLRNSTAKLQLTSDMPYMDQIIDYVGFMPESYNLKLYDNSSLLWLKNVIELHPDKRIFIFTHQFFPQKAGGNFGQGYSYTIDNGRITSSTCYCLSGIQFEFLNKLNNEHPNTIWFTGHSHYDFDTQITDRYVTICNKDFSIYKPGDNDFSQSNRYMKRNVKFAPVYSNGLSEYYETSTTNHIGEDVLYFDCPLKNGTYNISLWATSTYTSGRGFDSVLLDGETFNTKSVAKIVISYQEGGSQSFDLPSINNTVLSGITDESSILYTFNNVKVINNRIRIAINKTEAGTNWFACAIKSIINTTTNEDVTYKYDSNYYTAFGFVGIDGNHKLTNKKNVPSFVSYLYDSTYSKNNIIQVYKDKQKDTIVTNNSTGYNVHIPSTTRPLTSNYGKNHTLSTDYGSALRTKDSAGMIMDVYEDYVDIRGISFKLNDVYPNQYINKYHPLGQYRINIPSK